MKSNSGFSNIILVLIITVLAIVGYILLKTVSEDSSGFSNESEETVVIKCTSEQRNVDACITVYEPVCAKVNIQCITTPCDPINQIFSNSCEACKNPLVESYVIGECL